MTDEEAKKQFLVFAALRLSGLFLFFLGIVIAFTDFAQPGGIPAVGAVLAILGVSEAVFLPRLVRRGMTKK